MAQYKHADPISSMVPPHDIELEEQLLSTCMVAGQDDLAEILSMSSSKYFYKTAHQHVFDAINHLSSKAGMVDVVSVVSELKDSGLLEKVGGASFISGLLDVPMCVDIEYSCKRLEQKFQLRCAIELSYATIKKAFMSQDDPERVINFFVESSHTVSDISKAGNSVKGMREITIAMSDSYEERYASKKIVTGIPTGLHDLDMKTFGLHDGDLTLLAARPAMGKTALALNIARHAANLGYGVMIHSLEMPDSQLYDRLVAIETRIDGAKIRIGHFSKQEFSLVQDSLTKLYDLPIFIDDRGGLSLDELRRTVRRTVKRNPEIKLLIIDHIQLMSGNNPQNRALDIGFISSGLKTLAKELRIPILCLAQLNRELERRNNPYRRPKLSDLRDSGSLEQDADNVIFIYRPAVYGDDIDPRDGKTIVPINETDCELIIAKQRQGITGTAKCLFFDSIQRFESYSKVSPDEMYLGKIKSSGEKDE